LIITFFRPHFTRTQDVYGYRFDTVAAVKYLIENDFEQMKSYNILSGHDKAMDTIAEKLERESGLTVRAIPIWVGSGHLGCGKKPRAGKRQSPGPFTRAHFAKEFYSVFNGIFAHYTCGAYEL
jgi:nucleoside-diphosphate-sugar epimerase